MSDADFKSLYRALDRLESGAEARAEQLGEIRDTLTKQAGILDEHIRRSAANEANLEMLRAEFAPIKQHVAVAAAMFKVCAGVCAFAAGVAGFVETLRALGLFHH